MLDHKQFLDEICQRPNDMGARLVYSDWLEERGDVRAEFIRLAIAYSAWPELPQTCEEHHLKRGFCKRCKPYKVIRKQLAAMLDERRTVWTMAGLLEEFEWSDVYREIRQWKYQGADCYIKADFARGFPEILTLRWEEWQAHYRTLIDAMPVTKINLTTSPPFEYFDSDGQIVWFVGINESVFDVDDLKCKAGEDMRIEMLQKIFPGADKSCPIQYSVPADGVELNEAGGIAIPSRF